MKPFLKWVGGKTQILPQVLCEFPEQIHDYYEPFLGGGSVLLGVLSEKTISGTIYASDVNEKTIALFTHIKNQLDEFLIPLKKLVDTYNSIALMKVVVEKRTKKTVTIEDSLKTQEHYYYYIRSLYNSMESPTIEASAMLLFLNKTCFRGVYREGPHGFNVPFGNNKNVGIYDTQHLHDVSQLLQRVVFTACSFEDALLNVKVGDFVYLDPPYAPENDKSFVGYVEDGFSLEKHTQLFDICKSLKGKFLMSNADVALVKNAFPSPYITKIISAKRSIHSKDPSKKTNEVLITNFS